MKTYITLIILFFSLVVNSQNTITEAEYFIDTDPGVGNANTLTIAEATTINQLFSIPTTNITSGIHILHIRTKNNQNQWSLYGRQVFYKSEQIDNNTIVAAEYFIDTDPGVGNATSVAITQGALLDETLNIAIPNDLAAGDHVLHIRVQSSNDKWSLYGRPEFTSTLSNNEVVFENFKMYPNPVEDMLHISIQNNIIEKLTLVDLNGRVVLDKSTNLGDINLSKVPSGFYLLQIKTENGCISKKIIKK